MKQLKKWIGKEVELTTNKGHNYKGFIWYYMSDRSVGWANPEAEYYIGYDGGFMELIKPSEVKEIKAIKEQETC